MVDSYKVDCLENYYTVRQVAEIKGISKQAIIEGCKAGRYPGSKKIENNISRNGIWLIPRNIVDTPVITKDVAVITRQLTPQELQDFFKSAVHEEVKYLKDEIQELRKENTELKHEVLQAIETLGSRMDRHQKKNNFFTKLFFWR